MAPDREPPELALEADPPEFVAALCEQASAINAPHKLTVRIASLIDLHTIPPLNAASLSKITGKRPPAS
jgi:hypothetical protein